MFSFLYYLINLVEPFFNWISVTFNQNNLTHIHALHVGSENHPWRPASELVLCWFSRA